MRREWGDGDGAGVKRGNVENGSASMKRQRSRIPVRVHSLGFTGVIHAKPPPSTHPTTDDQHLQLVERIEQETAAWRTLSQSRRKEGQSDGAQEDGAHDDEEQGEQEGFDDGDEDGNAGQEVDETSPSSANTVVTAREHFSRRASSHMPYSPPSPSNPSAPYTTGTSAAPEGRPSTGTFTSLTSNAANNAPTQRRPSGRYSLTPSLTRAGSRYISITLEDTILPSTPTPVDPTTPTNADTPTSTPASPITSAAAEFTTPTTSNPNPTHAPASHGNITFAPITHSYTPNPNTNLVLTSFTPLDRADFERRTAAMTTNLGTGGGEEDDPFVQEDSSAESQGRGRGAGKDGEKKMEKKGEGKEGRGCFGAICGIFVSGGEK